MNTITRFAKYKLHPFHTSWGFLLLGVRTLMYTHKLFEGVCMIGCGCTSLIYHTTYHPMVRVVDIAWNVTTGSIIFFFYSRWYYWLTAPGMVFGAFIRTKNAQEAPLEHVLFLHLPALFGQACCAFLP